MFFGIGKGSPEAEIGKTVVVDEDRPSLVTAYGLCIQTSIVLPELVSGGKRPDVVIHRGILPPPLEERRCDVFYARATDREVFLFWNGVGAFLVKNGREIVVHPITGVDERVLRVYLLGAVLGVVLRQRGRLVVHASAVDVRGEVIAFMGTSGQGKSTTAAALHGLGYSLVTDDLLTFHSMNGDGPPIVTPGFPSLKLSPDSLRALGLHPHVLPLVNPLEDKRMQNVSAGFNLRERPLGRMYVLRDGMELRIDRLGPQEAFIELLRHTSSAHPGSVPVDNIPAHLRQCAEIVNRVPICRLTVPRCLDRLPELASRVESDLVSYR